MTDRVTEYARAVVSGKVPFCGRLHILSCKRHLRDLERQKTAGFPYYWDVNTAEKNFRITGTSNLPRRS